MYNLFRRIVAHISVFGKGKEIFLPKPKKMGRPVIGKPKDIRIALRVDKDTLKKLDDICKKKKISRSEYVRQLINENN